MIIFNAKPKLHDAILGICIIAQVGDNFPPLVISDNFIVGFDKSRGVLFPNFRKSSNYFFSRKFVELMGSFSSVNSQTTKSRSYFLGINSRTKLSTFFSTLTKFRKSSQLSHKSDTIFLFSNLSEFFKMICYQGKISTIQQQTRSLICLSNRITCFPATFSITINTLKDKFTEFFLSICKELFFSHKNTIVFLPYYFNLKTKRNGFEGTRKPFKCISVYKVCKLFYITQRFEHVYTFIHLHTTFFKNKNKINNMGRTLCKTLFV